MAKGNSNPGTMDPSELLSRMAGKPAPAPVVQEEITKTEEPAEERLNEAPISRTPNSSSSDKKENYEERFLKRSLIGQQRTNVGMSRETVEKAELVIARIFDNKIAVGVFLDNIVSEHFEKHKKHLNSWLAEKPIEIF